MVRWLLYVPMIAVAIALAVGHRDLIEWRREAQLELALAGADRLEVINPRASSRLASLVTIRGEEKLAGFAEAVDLAPRVPESRREDLILQFYDGDRRLAAFRISQRGWLLWQGGPWTLDHPLTDESWQRVKAWMGNVGIDPETLTPRELTDEQKRAWR